LLCLFWLLRKRVSPAEGLIILAVFAVNPELLAFQDNILSDIPFLLLSTLSVLLIDRFVCEKKDFSPSLFKNVTLGAAIFLTVFVRPTGVLLLVTLLGCQIIFILRRWNKVSGRKKVLLNFMTPYLVFGFLWVISVAVFPADSGQAGNGMLRADFRFSTSMLAILSS